MTLRFPTWLVNLGRGAAKLSQLIDEKFFPVDDESTEKDWAAFHEHRGKVEKAARAIHNMIDSCVTLEQTLPVMRMIGNMKKVHGNKEQVVGQMDSLHLYLYNRQRELLHKM